MKQHHYLFDSIDDLQTACFDLEDAGIKHKHLHVVNNDHLSLEKRHLNDAGAFGDTDLVHSALRGMIIGAVAAFTAALVTWQWVGGHELGAMVTAFVALIAMGFCTWLGGLVGASHDNWRLSPYHDQIQSGKSLLLVDVTPRQEPEVTRLMASIHREAMYAGESSSLELPLQGGWHLHLRETKEVA